VTARLATPTNNCPRNLFMVSLLLTFSLGHLGCWFARVVASETMASLPVGLRKTGALIR
jgi:hypothetical protein